MSRTSAARPAGYSKSTPTPASSPAQTQCPREPRISAAKSASASGRCPKTVGPSEPAIVPTASVAAVSAPAAGDEPLPHPPDQECQGEQRDAAAPDAERPERPAVRPDRLRPLDRPDDRSRRHRGQRNAGRLVRVPVPVREAAVDGQLPVGVDVDLAALDDRLREREPARVLGAEHADEGQRPERD